MELTAAISHEGSWFVARCLELEVASQGETLDGALDELREAVLLLLEGDDAPTIPAKAVVKTFALPG